MTLPILRFKNAICSCGLLCVQRFGAGGGGGGSSFCVISEVRQCLLLLIFAEMLVVVQSSELHPELETGD